MENRNNTPRLLFDEKTLMSRLLTRATTTNRFKLPMTADQATRLLLAAVRAEVEYRSRSFALNDSVAQQAAAIARQLAEPGSKFGLCLCGGVGNGKSTFVKAFQQILNQLCLRPDGCREPWRMRIVDARTIAYMCKNDFAGWQALSKIAMLAIDDLGTEPTEVHDYGNVLEPITDLLLRRYDRQLFTIVTTNLNPATIRNRYGDRIADRMNEMMHKVVFSNGSYRSDTAA